MTEEEQLFLAQQQAERDAQTHATPAPAPPSSPLAMADKFASLSPSPPSGMGITGGLPPGMTAGAAMGFAPPPAPPAQASPPPAPMPAQAAPSAGAQPPQNAEAKAIADEQKAFGAQADAKAAEGPANQAIEDQKASGFEAKSAEALRQAKEYGDAQKVAAQAHVNAVAEAQSAADEYKNFKFQDFWAKGRNDVPLRSTGSRIVTIVGAFLGGYANPGGPNAVLDMIKRETERDFDKQKMQLQSKENIASLKRQGVKDVDEFQRDQLARLQIKQGMAMQSIADHIDAQTATATGKLRAAEGKTAADAIRTQGAQQAALGQHALVQSNLTRAQTSEAYAAASKNRAEAKAAGAKAGATDDEIFYDKQGNAVGLVAKGRGGAQAFATRDANFQDALDKMQAYKAYIDKIGGRPRSLAEIKQARVLYKSAGLAVGAVSPNGTTKEAQENEAATLGPDPSSITGWAQGPMASAVGDKIKQVQTLKDDYRTQMLRPLSGRQQGTVSAVPNPAAPVQALKDPALQGAVPIMKRNKRTGQMVQALKLTDGREVIP